jgi:hypothetical protein
MVLDLEMLDDDARPLRQVLVEATRAWLSNGSGA